MIKELCFNKINPAGQIASIMQNMKLSLQPLGQRTDVNCDKSVQNYYVFEQRAQCSVCLGPALEHSCYKPGVLSSEQGLAR